MTSLLNLQKKWRATADEDGNIVSPWRYDAGAYHNGRSTGPKTEAGRSRIAEAQRRRWLAYRESKIASTNAAEGKDWFDSFLNNPDE